ncbi:uncharacterized protein LOC135715706 [Ochlerotatus camptorhynchus]|uniref:uncharacterized protein LOC135715706 n=1 Tax=Ochlerotatus camptorhynchus TaxID=644619 RepID=UPI0031CF800B
MGIRHLETYVCSEVRNGFVKTNIEFEINKYYVRANQPNPPPPIIVIDLMSLYRPVSHADLPGLLCGGRFNQVAHLLEQFFVRIKNLGAELVFFYDGPVQDTKYDTWTQRQDEKYNKIMEIIDSVDRASDLAWMASRFRNSIPNNTLYPVRQMASKHGELIISIAKECDQELAAYANQVQAIAIISNDTDFMIYKGFWRYWSAKDIHFETLDTMEYNRLALVRNMGLSFKQMRLLATLGGNDVIKYEEVRHFHSKLGSPREKFPRLADFVRQQALPESLHQDKILCSLLNHVFGKAAVNEDLKERFLASLDFYETDYQPQNTNIIDDPVVDVLLKLENTFLFQIWVGRPVNVTAFFVDMRRGEFGEHYPHLVIPLVMRQAGVVLYHRQMLSDSSTRKIMIKMSHDAGHSFQNLPVEFPQHITPPPLLDLLSRQIDIQTSLQDIKRQLFAWIASDTLDHRRLQSVPDRLLAPVATLYYLVEKHILDVFEADVLLQVSHDVVFQTYDFQAVKYPTMLGKRPFRIAFLYLKIYNHFSKIRTLLGFDEEPFLFFDGVLFHNRYAEAVKQAASLEQIKQWRIYDVLVEK